MPSAISAVARVKPNLARLTSKPSILNYNLESTLFEVPTGFRLPPKVREDVFDLEHKALVTINAMKKLIMRRNERFYALCPRESPIFDQHVLSIDHLLAWKAEWDPIDPTLSVSAKIPAHVLNILADEEAYSNVAWQYDHIVDAYLNGQFHDWIQSRKDIDHLAHRLMCNPRSLKWNNLHDHQAFCAWYNGEFAEAMSEWETCLSQLILPSYRETVLELRDMLNARVENGVELL